MSETIIRNEASDFYKSRIKDFVIIVVDEIHKLKTRLKDFYSPEHKAIFLDEIKLNIERAPYDQQTDFVNESLKRLLFYVQQEIDNLPAIAHQKNKTNFKQERDSVFISYSHLNEDYLSDIKRHFKPFLGKLNIWDDTRLIPGQIWKQEIKKAIAKTKVAILLVSTEFLGSPFIETDELPPLLKAAEENGAVILIVILKPCLFEDFDHLNKFQTFNPPSKSVMEMSEIEREKLYVNLVRQTKRVLENHA